MEDITLQIALFIVYFGIGVWLVSGSQSKSSATSSQQASLPASDRPPVEPMNLSQPEPEAVEIPAEVAYPTADMRQEFIDWGALQVKPATEPDSPQSLSIPTVGVVGGGVDVVINGGVDDALNDASTESLQPSLAESDETGILAPVSIDVEKKASKRSAKTPKATGTRTATGRSRSRKGKSSETAVAT